jgi:hypothetical protein
MDLVVRQYIEARNGGWEVLFGLIALYIRQYTYWEIAN